MMRHGISNWSQKDLENVLVKDCGMRIIGRYRGVTTMEYRVNQYTLPPPRQGHITIGMKYNIY